MARRAERVPRRWVFFLKHERENWFIMFTFQNQDVRILETCLWQKVAHGNLIQLLYIKLCIIWSFTSLNCNFWVNIFSFFVKHITEMDLQNHPYMFTKIINSSYLSRSWRIVVTGVRWATYLHELEENVYVCYVNLTYEYRKSISPNSRRL